VLLALRAIALPPNRVAGAEPDPECPSNFPERLPLGHKLDHGPFPLRQPGAEGLPIELAGRPCSRVFLAVGEDIIEGEDFPSALFFAVGRLLQRYQPGAAVQVRVG
jgi:hypothetical protein